MKEGSNPTDDGRAGMGEVVIKRKRRVDRVFLVFSKNFVTKSQDGEHTAGPTSTFPCPIHLSTLTSLPDYLLIKQMFLSISYIVGNFLITTFPYTYNDYFIASLCLFI